MMKKILLLMVSAMSVMISMAQTSIFNGKFEGYKSTDTLTVYVQGEDAVRDINVDSKGKFTVSADVKELTEAMLFLKGRGEEGREHSCCLLMEPGKTCGFTISLSKPDASGKTTLLAKFTGEDPAKQTYANQYYQEFSLSTDLNSETLVKNKSYADCKKYLDGVFAPMRETLAKVKDAEFAKLANNAIESQYENSLLTFAVEAEKAGTKMNNDKDFMTFVNSINPNDTLDAGKITSYLQWYQQAHGDEFLPLTAEAAQLNHLASYSQNQDVRNKVANSYIQAVLFYASFGVSPSSSEFKDLYTQYLKVATDTTYVPFVKEQLEKMKATAEGQPALDFTLQDSDGKEYHFKDIVGNGVVTYVDFWATWCGPCKREIPYLAKMVEALKDNKNVRIISVSIDEDKEAWKKMIAADKPAWEQFIVPNLTTCDAITKYDITSIPRFMLFDKQGNLAKSSATRPSDESTKTLIEELAK